MILMIDNYDSFTFNLVHYFEGLDQEVVTYRHDAITVSRAKQLNPDYIVISPGPCTPKESGVSIPLIEAFAGVIPILGVCLGMQCIATVYGGDVIRAPAAVHGKTAQVKHQHQGAFKGLPNPLTVARYHSLVVSAGLPDDLTPTAWIENDDHLLLMGLQHKAHPIYGVQFHPEAILTEAGCDLLQNFLKA